MIRRDIELSFGRSQLQNYSSRGASAGPRPWETRNRLGGITSRTCTPYQPKPVAYDDTITLSVGHIRPVRRAGRGLSRHSLLPNESAAHSRENTPAMGLAASAMRRPTPAAIEPRCLTANSNIVSDYALGSSRNSTRVPPLDTDTVVRNTPNDTGLQANLTGRQHSIDARPSPVRNPDQLGHGLIPCGSPVAPIASSLPSGTSVTWLDAALERLIQEEDAALARLRRRIASRASQSHSGGAINAHQSSAWFGFGDYECCGCILCRVMVQWLSATNRDPSQSIVIVQTADACRRIH